MGPIEVPADALYGAQTMRSRLNFPIGDDRMPLEVVRALALVKKAAARTNAALGELDPSIAALIERAADEVIGGMHDDQFPLVVWQTGSGTQTNMNVNEVIAGRANELAGGARGGRSPVHPNDHVNRGQSSNDAFPTAMHLAIALAIEVRLLPRVRALIATLDAKSEAYARVIKTGRTHLMDAVPLTLGQAISGWSAQLRMGLDAIESSLPSLRELALGGTAVGTGLNAHPRFAERVAAELARESGRPFVSAPNKFAALAGHEAIVRAHGALMVLATACTKLANDVRLLASGPRAGLGELRIPDNEPGSSIMPGKVNPTQCEALAMVCCRVMGNATTIAMAASQGSLELNTYKPVIVHAALESIALLGDACESFELRCARGLEPDEKVIARHLERSLMRVTALAPRIGYDAAAKVAKHALADDLTLREAALALGVLDAEELDALLDPSRMLGGQ